MPEQVCFFHYAFVAQGKTNEGIHFSWHIGTFQQCQYMLHFALYLHTLQAVLRPLLLPFRLKFAPMQHVPGIWIHRTDTGHGRHCSAQPPTQLQGRPWHQVCICAKLWARRVTHRLSHAAEAPLGNPIPASALLLQMLQSTLSIQKVAGTI